MNVKGVGRGFIMFQRVNGYELRTLTYVNIYKY